MFAKLLRYALYVTLCLFAWNALASVEMRRKFRRITVIVAGMLIASSVISLGLYLFHLD